MRLSRLALPILALLAACSDPSSKTTAQTRELSGAPLPAPTRMAPPDAAAMRLSFAPIVKRAAPAVVNVHSERRVRQQVDPFWEFFGGGGVPRERVEGSLGSGAIVREDGIVVTNNHVIEGGDQLRVVLSDRREFPAKVLLADPRSDLAVLKIDTKGEKLPVLPMADRDDAQVGDLVLAIGDPFGVGQTVTNGIVSALARTDIGITDFSFFIQTDAPINPGNSGGPLVDMAGNMIGLNTAIFSRTGASAGIGFAIPAPMVRRVVESALGGGSSVVRPWFGARTQNVDADIARSLGLDRPQGVLVASVYPDGPADRAGIKQGDVLLALDGQSVGDQGALNYLVATRKPGDQIQARIWRSGAARTVTVRVERPPAEPARDQRTLGGRQPLTGATVVNLSPAVAEELGVDAFLKGVLVTAPGQGIAAQAGFRRGDIIRQVNGRDIARVSDLVAATTGASNWTIVLERDGRQVTANF
ncbi:MAG: Do family serine endopeptidase [Caulobacteraceae bacterium]